MSLLDYGSLLIAIGFSCAALFVAMFLTWLQSRQDAFLFRLSCGAFLIAASVPLTVPKVSAGSLVLPPIAFLLLLSGFSALHQAAVGFHGGEVRKRAIPLLAAAAWLPCGLAYAFGLGGAGIVFGNMAASALLFGCAFEYRLSFREAPRQVVLLAFLYSAEAMTFVFCAAMALVTVPLDLRGFPTNWAEDLNAIMAIVGITGVGAVSLSMHQVRQSARHREEAMTDSLTGLLNRRAIFEKLGKKRLPERTAVALLDLDNFKAVNDTHGHECGDDALRRFSACVRTALPADTTAARIGGEEFAVVLRSTSMDSAVASLDRLRDAFSREDILTDSGPIRCTISVGVAYSGNEGLPFEELVRQADKALYSAKQGGRNQVARASFGLAA